MSNIAKLHKGINVSALRAKMSDLRVTDEMLADATGVSIVALKSKLNGETEFTWREINKAAQRLLLNRDEIAKIFFGGESARTSPATGRNTRVLNPFERR